MAGAAVAGSLASAFVRIAIAKLGSAPAQQASLLWNFSKDLEDMKDVLETISAALQDAERRSVNEAMVRLWLKRLKDAALDISDMLEDYQDTSDQANAKDLGVLSCLPFAYKKTAMANRMKSMREKLSRISMDFEKFNFINTQDTSSSIVQHYDKRETTSGFLPDVKGRGREKQEIINLISASTNNDESKTTIVSIYGLGGMGKTTLAQLVYSDHQFKKYDHRIWVYVSQEFNLLQMGSSIISQLQIEGGQQNVDPRCWDLQVIIKCLEDLLRGKKILIVLDDLWEEDHNELMKLKSMLQVDKKGSMIDIIVTTREEGIAKNICTSEPYNLQPLNDDVCWEIIKKYSKSNQREFELIGLEIANKCGGVPLAAQALGFMLQSKDLPEWQKINNSDIWNETSKDGVLPSLKLSYQRMPQQLKICFSYCAIFSKGHNIVQDDLIHQWSALGFIETSKGKDYIKQLLGMSFLQVSKLPSTSQKHVVQYTMHDLVHDLARLTMADELVVFNGAPWRNARAHKYCYYSLLKNYDRSTKLANILPLKMRAVRFSGSDELYIRSGAFSFAKCLRILDFSECSGILLPASIGQVKQLRCLIAPIMKNESLPECITELSKLQYLRLNGSTQISALPESFGKLGGLRYLCLSGCRGISELPESFAGLKSMVHLDMSGCSGIRQLPESFGDLKCMVRLDMSGCSGIRELPDSLGKLTNLQHLELSGCSRLKAIPDPLCGLRQLQYLNMSCCKQIRELPEAIMKLQNLLHLDLSSCTRMQHLGGLHGLTALQHLDMSRSMQIGVQDLSGALANLTNLKYLDLGNLIKSGSAESASYVPDWIGGMTNLEHLDLSWNCGLACLPASIGNLKRLHTLNLSGCECLRSLPESIGALGLMSLVLRSCSDKLVDQASSLVHFSKSLPDFKVRADDVNGCSNLHLLEEINISELRIRCLENVRSLEEANEVKLLEKQNLSKLKLAWTGDAVRLLEDKDLLGQLVPPKGLKHMCLEGYSSADFPGWLMGSSHHLANLVSIQLCDLPTCRNLPPLGQLPHLEKMKISRLPSIKKIDKEFCGGKGAFRRLSALEVVSMERLEEWSTTYSVEDGVEFMFPVLDTLSIRFCQRLRLKPCPPTFRKFFIFACDQVFSLLEEVDQSSRPSSPNRAIKLDMQIHEDNCQSKRLFHHFPNLRELRICGELTRLPESMQHLTSLQSLELAVPCISALPEWLGDLSSLKSLVIDCCFSIESLPSCIQHLPKLQKIEIRWNVKLKQWCESEENKAKLAHINVDYHDR